MKKLKRLLPSKSMTKTTLIVMKYVAFLRLTCNGKLGFTLGKNTFAKMTSHRGRVLNVNTPTIKRNVEASRFSTSSSLSLTCVIFVKISSMFFDNDINHNIHYPYNN